MELFNNHFASLKRTSTSYENQLRLIDIVHKLKQIKSSTTYHKFLNRVTRNEFTFGQILRNNSEQPFTMLLIARGKLSCQQNNDEIIIQGPNYIILDSSIGEVKTYSNYNVIYQLKQRDIYDIFQGLIDFPNLNVRIKNMLQIDIFKNFTRKKMLSLAKTIQQIRLGINTTIYNQTQIIKYCYIIVEGSVLLKKNDNKISIISKNYLFGIPIDNYQESRYLETARVISEKIILYKIKIQVIRQQSQQNATNFYRKRLSWRQERLKQQQKMKKKVQEIVVKRSDKKISFIEKQIILKSFYKEDTQAQSDQGRNFFAMLKQKHGTKQQFYQHRLDEIKLLRSQKYGQFKQPIIFFSFQKKRVPLRVKTLDSSIKR